MSKKAAEHHKKASEHLTHAARHHGEAAKHHEAGSHEKAAHHAHVARGHVIHGRGHAEEAVKAHLEEHGKLITSCDGASSNEAALGGGELRQSARAVAALKSPPNVDGL